MKDEGNNIILRKTVGFALEIIRYAELLEEKRKFDLSKQLLKSGTANGAHVHEAQNVKSKNDFIHEFKIATKKAS